MSMWDDIFARAEEQYGLPTGLLAAIAKQENVNPSYNNPLGLSGDSGVYRFSEGQAPAHIYSQARLMTDPSGPYKDFVRTGNIADLAKVYSPVGASNDIRGTNATEAAGILANMPSGWQQLLVGKESAPTPTVPQLSSGQFASNINQVFPQQPSATDKFATAFGGALSRLGSGMIAGGQQASQAAIQNFISRPRPAEQALSSLAANPTASLFINNPYLQMLMQGGY